MVFGFRATGVAAGWLPLELTSPTMSTNITKQSPSPAMKVPSVEARTDLKKSFMG